MAVSKAQGRARAALPVEAAVGLLLCVSVAMVSVAAPRPDQLLPAPWLGVTVHDLVFPVLVGLSGAGMAFAHSAGRRTSVVRAALLLLLCGLAFNAVAAATADLASIRWTGELQVYAVVVLAVGLLHSVVRGPRAWALVTVALAVGQSALLVAWQAGCPGAALMPGCNPSRVVDEALFGAGHMYAAGALGHDPDGVVALLGALVTACAGVAAGHLLAARGGLRPPAYLLAWAASLALLAVVAGQLLPTMRGLWTTPFALASASLAVALLALVAAVLAVPVPRRVDRLRDRGSWPLVAMGRNSVLVYFGSQLLMVVLLTRADDDGHPWANVIGEQLEALALGHNRTGLVALMLGLWLCVAALLHSRRVYLRP